MLSIINLTKRLSMNNISGVPFQIKTEGEQISIKFVKTSPTTARISWNVPRPAIGCDPESQAYNGIIVTLDNQPISQNTTPVDGVVYTADTTADSDLHAGDKIGTALVVGAFYNDKETVSFDITGLSATTPYYVSGFAVDAQNRYHSEGTHAYSLPYGTEEGKKEPGYQLIQIGFQDETDPFDVYLFQGHSSGVRGSEPTGLDQTQTYSFSICYDGNDEIEVTINGADAQTYDDLINALNDKLALLGNPPIVNGYPNENSYYYNETTKKLFLFDGQSYTELAVVVEETDPTTPIDGDLWFDGTSLRKYNIITASWEVVTYFSYDKNPTLLTCNDVWFNGTKAHTREGNVWCEKTTIVSENDPSLGLTPPCSAFWYNTETGYLNKWKTSIDCNNVATGEWIEVSAFYLDFDPLSMIADDLWFDETNQVLNKLDASSVWNPVLENVYIAEEEPLNPVLNEFWFNPSTEDLLQWDGAAWFAPLRTDQTIAQIVIWPENPFNVESCDLWWNKSTNELFIWDTQTTSWVLVQAFYESATDPTLPPNLDIDTYWFNTVETLQKWDGSEWVNVSFFEYASDVTNLGALPTDDFWYNDDSNTWNKWNGSEWEIVDVSTTLIDPYQLPVGTFWYNPTTKNLQRIVSIFPVVWSTVLYSPSPIEPQTGFTFYNTNTEQLLMWNGDQYQQIAFPVTAALNDDGNLVLISATVGSSSYVKVNDGSLFSSLELETKIDDPKYGTDPVSSVPMYNQLGVGDDGSQDERRELIYSIRAQLGEPVVQVELTNYQIDTAITSGLESLRKRSAIAYKRVFFFLDVQPGVQRYLMTDERVGFNKIVQVAAAYRYQSSYLGNAGAQGAYGQAMLQHLYQMGSFDLVSYHLVSEYVELLNHMFAAYLNYTWDEDTRMLSFHQTFGSKERILLDANIERTEQSLLKDRYCKTWIERYALGTAQLILAEIRGKYSTLPGAGGGVTLNAGELRVAGEANIQQCYEQIENFIVNDVESHGYETRFIMG